MTENSIDNRIASREEYKSRDLTTSFFAILVVFLTCLAAYPCAMLLNYYYSELNGILSGNQVHGRQYYSTSSAANELELVLYSSYDIAFQLAAFPFTDQDFTDESVRQAATTKYSDIPGTDVWASMAVLTSVKVGGPAVVRFDDVGRRALVVFRHAATEVTAAVYWGEEDGYKATFWRVPTSDAKFSQSGVFDTTTKVTLTVPFDPVDGLGPGSKFALPADYNDAVLHTRLRFTVPGRLTPGDVLGLTPEQVAQLPWLSSTPRPDSYDAVALYPITSRRSNFGRTTSLLVPLGDYMSGNMFHYADPSEKIINPETHNFGDSVHTVQDLCISEFTANPLCSAGILLFRPPFGQEMEPVLINGLVGGTGTDFAAVPIPRLQRGSDTEINSCTSLYDTAPSDALYKACTLLLEATQMPEPIMLNEGGFAPLHDDSIASRWAGGVGWSRDATTRPYVDDPAALITGLTPRRLSTCDHLSIDNGSCPFGGASHDWEPIYLRLKSSSTVLTESMDLSHFRPTKFDVTHMPKQFMYLSDTYVPTDAVAAMHDAGKRQNIVSHSPLIMKRPLYPLMGFEYRMPAYFTYSMISTAEFLPGFFFSDGIDPIGLAKYDNFILPFKNLTKQEAAELLPVMVLLGQNLRESFPIVWVFYLASLGAILAFVIATLLFFVNLLIPVRTMVHVVEILTRFDVHEERELSDVLFSPELSQPWREPPPDASHMPQLVNGGAGTFIHHMTNATIGDFERKPTDLVTIPLTSLNNSYYLVHMSDENAFLTASDVNTPTPTATATATDNSIQPAFCTAQGHSAATTIAPSPAGDVTTVSHTPASLGTVELADGPFVRPFGAPELTSGLRRGSGFVMNQFAHRPGDRHFGVDAPGSSDIDSYTDSDTDSDTPGAAAAAAAGSDLSTNSAPIPDVSTSDTPPIPVSAHLDRAYPIPIISDYSDDYAYTPYTEENAISITPPQGRRPSYVDIMKRNASTLTRPPTPDRVRVQDIIQEAITKAVKHETIYLHNAGGQAALTHRSHINGYRNIFSEPVTDADALNDEANGISPRHRPRIADEYVPPADQPGATGKYPLPMQQAALLGALNRVDYISQLHDTIPTASEEGDEATRKINTIFSVLYKAFADNPDEAPDYQCSLCGVILPLALLAQLQTVLGLSEQTEFLDSTDPSTFISCPSCRQICLPRPADSLPVRFCVTNLPDVPADLTGGGNGPLSARSHVAVTQKDGPTPITTSVIVSESAPTDTSFSCGPLGGHMGGSVVENLFNIPVPPQTPPGHSRHNSNISLNAIPSSPGPTANDPTKRRMSVFASVQSTPDILNSAHANFDRRRTVICMNGGSSRITVTAAPGTRTLINITPIATLPPPHAAILARAQPATTLRASLQNAIVSNCGFGQSDITYIGNDRSSRGDRDRHGVVSQPSQIALALNVGKILPHFTRELYANIRPTAPPIRNDQLLTRTSHEIPAHVKQLLNLDGPVPVTGDANRHPLIFRKENPRWSETGLPTSRAVCIDANIPAWYTITKRATSFDHDHETVQLSGGRGRRRNSLPVVASVYVDDDYSTRMHASDEFRTLDRTLVSQDDPNTPPGMPIMTLQPSYTLPEDVAAAENMDLSIFDYAIAHGVDDFTCARKGLQRLGVSCDNIDRARRRAFTDGSPRQHRPTLRVPHTAKFVERALTAAAPHLPSAIRGHAFSHERIYEDNDCSEPEATVLHDKVGYEMPELPESNRQLTSILREYHVAVSELSLRPKDNIPYDSIVTRIAGSSFSAAERPGRSGYKETMAVFQSSTERLRSPPSINEPSSTTSLIMGKNESPKVTARVSAPLPANSLLIPSNLMTVIPRAILIDTLLTYSLETFLPWMKKEEALALKSALCVNKSKIFGPAEASLLLFGPAILTPIQNFYAADDSFKSFNTRRHISTARVPTPMSVHHSSGSLPRVTTAQPSHDSAPSALATQIGQQSTVTTTTVTTTTVTTSGQSVAPVTAHPAVTSQVSARGASPDVVSVNSIYHHTSFYATQPRHIVRTMQILARRMPRLIISTSSVFGTIDHRYAAFVTITMLRARLLTMMESPLMTVMPQPTDIPSLIKSTANISPYSAGASKAAATAVANRALKAQTAGDGTTHTTFSEYYRPVLAAGFGGSLESTTTAGAGGAGGCGCGNIFISSANVTFAADTTTNISQTRWWEEQADLQDEMHVRMFATDDYATNKAVDTTVWDTRGTPRDRALHQARKNLMHRIEETSGVLALINGVLTLFNAMDDVAARDQCSNAGNTTTATNETSQSFSRNIPPPATPERQPSRSSFTDKTAPEGKHSRKLRGLTDELVHAAICMMIHHDAEAATDAQALVPVLTSIPGHDRTRKWAIDEFGELADEQTRPNTAAAAIALASAPTSVPASTTPLPSGMVTPSSRGSSVGLPVVGPLPADLAMQERTLDVWAVAGSDLEPESLPDDLLCGSVPARCSTPIDSVYNVDNNGSGAVYPQLQSGGVYDDARIAAKMRSVDFAPTPDRSSGSPGAGSRHTNIYSRMVAARRRAIAAARQGYVCANHDCAGTVSDSALDMPRTPLTQTMLDDMRHYVKTTADAAAYNRGHALEIIRPDNLTSLDTLFSNNGSVTERNLPSQAWRWRRREQGPKVNSVRKELETQVLFGANRSPYTARGQTPVMTTVEPSTDENEVITPRRMSRRPSTTMQSDDAYVSGGSGGTTGLLSATNSIGARTYGSMPKFARSEEQAPAGLTMESGRSLLSLGTASVGAMPTYRLTTTSNSLHSGHFSQLFPGSHDSLPHMSISLPHGAHHLTPPKYPIVTSLPTFHNSPEVDKCLSKSSDIIFMLRFLAMLVFAPVTLVIAMVNAFLARLDDALLMKQDKSDEHNLDLPAADRPKFTRRDLTFKEFIGACVTVFDYPVARRLRRASYVVDRSIRSFERFVPEAVAHDTRVLGQPAILSMADHDCTIMMISFDSPILRQGVWGANDSDTVAVECVLQLFKLCCTNVTAGHGTIDKIMGSTMLAFWNAPRPVRSYHIEAVKTAFNCMRGIDALNEAWERSGNPKLSVYIGLTSGNVMFGNLGFTTGDFARFDNTVLGDRVNTCHRIMRLNITYGTRLLCDIRTYKYINDAVLCRWLDTVQMKGKNEAEKVFEILGLKDDNSLPPGAVDYVADYEECLESLISFRYDQAERILQRIERKWRGKLPWYDTDVRHFRAKIRNATGQTNVDEAENEARENNNARPQNIVVMTKK